MWTSEFAYELETPVAMIKHYLRESLLVPDERINAREVSYGQGYMGRLWLIRAMVKVLEASTEQVRKILQAVDDTGRDLLLAMSKATVALPSMNVPAASDPRVRELPAQIGLERITHPQGANADAVAERLSAATGLCENSGIPMDEDQLKAYTDAALEMAESDFARIPEGKNAVVFVMFDMAFRESVLLAMRRAAHREAGYRAASSLKESGVRSFGE